MLKLVMMPPQNNKNVRWANQLVKELPQYQVSLPETDEEARGAIVDADAAFGVVPPEVLAAASTSGGSKAQLQAHPWVSMGFDAD